MDITKLTQDKENAEATVASLTGQLADANTVLQNANDALTYANSINFIEGLDADGVSKFNADLQNDSDNKLAVSLSLPPATE